MSALLERPVRRRELTMVAWPRTRRLPLLREAPRPVRLSGNHRSRVTMPGYHAGRRPGNFGKTYPAELLTRDEMLRLLSATGNGFAGCRDRALYVLLWRTGLRISEALALLPKDVDLERGAVTVLHGKNDKRRVVGMDPQTIEEVQRWMTRRATLGVGRQHPVFCVISKPTVGKWLYSACVREQLRDCAKRAGIDKRVAPHQLRHLMASEWAAEGIPINVISKALGHSNSGVTARYIDHISNEEAILVAHTRSWVAG